MIKTLGNLGEWVKKPGDEIAPGDVLIEIETDKASMEFESAEEGWLAKVLVPSGAKDVKIHTVFFNYILNNTANRYTGRRKRKCRQVWGFHS